MLPWGRGHGGGPEPDSGGGAAPVSWRETQAAGWAVGWALAQSARDAFFYIYSARKKKKKKILNELQNF